MPRVVVHPSLVGHQRLALELVGARLHPLEAALQVSTSRATSSRRAAGSTIASPSLRMPGSTDASPSASYGVSGRVSLIRTG